MSFDANGVICTDIHKASLQLMSDEEVKRTAVCRVYSSIVYDGIQPKIGGIHDPRMGPMDSEPRRGDPSCVTCGGRDDCPGHLGFIELHLPIFHPLFIGSLVRLMKCMCLICRRLKVDSSVTVEFLKRFRDLSEGARRVNPEDIGATATSIENWRHLTKEVYDTCSQAYCSHCGRKFTCNVHKKDLDSCIELQWSYDSDCPVDRSVLLKLLDYQEEMKQLGEGAENMGTIRDIKHLTTIDDEVIAKDHKILGRRGRAMGSCQLEAYQVYPMIRDLFNSSDRELLVLLTPATAIHGAKFFFTSVVPVSSNKFRPKASGLGFGAAAEDGVKDESGGILHPRSAALLEILQENSKVGFALASLRYQEDSALTVITQEASAAMLPSLNTKDKAGVEKAIVDHRGNYSLLHQYCKSTQEKVNSYVDNTKNRTRNAPPAIRQWMEKKSGAIRQKMMGKRVNFAARTTIAPDAQINTNEIGIPIPFAMKLSIQEHANPQNVELLCKLVMNGSKIYPGCNMIIEPSGRRLDVTRRELTEGQKQMQCKLIRNYVAQQHSPQINGKILRPYTVLRHLRDGDVVIMNRQPSLHRASMMAHFVRVLTGQKTFRLHYANCNSYNADFDGDEMNLHCAQDYSARAEAAIFCNADCNYNVAKSGEPLRGLIQDHVLGGNFLTVRGCFLTKSEYFTLIYVGVGLFVDKGEKIDLTPSGDLRVVIPEFSSGDPYARLLSCKNIRVIVDDPVILKPEKLYTGKQVITAILRTLIDSAALMEYGTLPDGSVNKSFLRKYRGINLRSKSKTPGDAWNGCLGSDKEEQTVIIRNSELLQGVFDKSQIGASAYGLIHLCYELFGPRVAGMLLSVFARVFSTYLQIRGFSCSSGDFQMTNAGEEARDKLIMQCTAAGTIIQELFVDSVYKHMRWKENPVTLHDRDAANAEVEKLAKIIEEQCGKRNGAGGGASSSGDSSKPPTYEQMKEQQSLIAASQSKSMTIDGLLKTTPDGSHGSSEGKDKGSSDKAVSPYWPLLKTRENLKADDWARTRAIQSIVSNNDWRCNPDMTDSIKWIQKKLSEIKALGLGDPATRQILLMLLIQNPQIAIFFPTLAEKIKSRMLWSSSPLDERILLSSSSQQPEGKKCLLPPPRNSSVTLMNGNVVTGDGLLRSPKLYHPSWCWTGERCGGEREDLPFESPLRYIVRALNLKRSDMKSQQELSRPTILLPNELTRLRMERLVRDHFSGREKTFLDMFDKFFQSNMSRLSSRNNDLVTGDVSLYPFPQNGFSSMITTGAKGSKVNFAMICGMLSQQSLEGKRVPLMVSGRTHPSFAPWDLGARAGGLITDRYLTGLRPPEYFFHCMAGREGLVDTAVKTARSGYLQRCVIKSLEGMVVSYDGSVREGDGSIVQFLYGEDGADVAKMIYLHNIKDLLANSTILEARYASKSKLQSEVLKSRLKTIDQALVKSKESSGGGGGGGIEEKEEKVKKEPGGGGSATTSRPPTLAETYAKEVASDPISTSLTPFCFPGSISEWYEKALDNQVEAAVKNEVIASHLLESGMLKKHDLKKRGNDLLYRSDGRMSSLGRILRLKYRSALAEPGDAVGCLAAQSMGEPATQMTLNTFHLAGHGAANVTLGIPRLREILQTAGAASTPVLYIPIKQGSAEEVHARCRRLVRGFRKITLRDVINSVGIEANIYGSRKPGMVGLLEKSWGYECTIQFENLEHFCKIIPKYTPQKIINFTINRVVRELMKTVNKLMAIYSTKAAEEMWDSDEDELTQAVDKFVFERNIRSIQDKKKAMKEAVRAAGIGFGAVGGVRPGDGDDGADFLTTADDFGAIYKKGSKKKNDEDADDEQGDDEFDTDVSNDDSEDTLTDPNGSDGEILEDDEEDGDGADDLLKANKAGATTDDGQSGAEQTEGEGEDVEMMTAEETIAEHKAKIKSQKKESRRLAKLDEIEPDRIEEEALWSEGEGAGYKSKQLPSEAFRYMTDLKVCRKTWRIVIKWGWPVRRCPRKIEFMPSLVRIIGKQILQNTPGVANPHVVAPQDARTKNCPAEVQCEGSNLEWLSQLSDECVDHCRVATNDIRAIFRFYGVEAGRASIIHELSSVFGVYGITVDYRHLSLIADSMTRSGEFRAFSRLGMSYHSSPLLQMSFETSIKFLTEGVERGAVDNLQCPSGAIVVGRTINVGTGVSRPLTRLAATS